MKLKNSSSNPSLSTPNLSLFSPLRFEVLNPRWVILLISFITARTKVFNALSQFSVARYYVHPFLNNTMWRRYITMTAKMMNESLKFEKFLC
jgi:hypothetical protein